MSEQTKYTTVRVEQDIFDEIERLQARMALRNYDVLPPEMKDKAKPTKQAVMAAAVNALKVRMDAEDFASEAKPTKS